MATEPAQPDERDRWRRGRFETHLRPHGLGGDAQIWLVDPEDPGPYGDLGLLSPKEQARARRYLRPTDQRQFIAAHALLRVKLAEALGCGPDEVGFEAGPHGRPEVAAAQQPSGRLSFSLSHTRGLVGCALAWGVVIGLDLEPLRPVDALAMAPGILDETERADVAGRAGAARWRRFLQYWTVKEAALKVRGTGLTLPADRCQVRWTDDGDGSERPVVVALPDGAEAARHRVRGWLLGADGA